MHTVGSLVVRLLQECEGDLTRPVEILEYGCEAFGIASVGTKKLSDSASVTTLVRGQVHPDTRWQKA